MSLEVLDILRVIALLTFAGGTSFLGALISKYKKFGDQQILFLTAFGAGILISAAIFETVHHFLIISKEAILVMIVIINALN
jgi:hypothetical protein